MHDSTMWLQFGVVLVIGGALLTGLLFVRACAAGADKQRVVRGLVQVWACVLGFLAVGFGLRALHGEAFVDVNHGLNLPQSGYNLATSPPHRPAEAAITVVGLALMAGLGVLALRSVRVMLGEEPVFPEESDQETDDTPA